ncbi:MAG TPA: AmmeMemoRadiSam system radical SAM enzyme [candidate division Zixibacteria bacterium]|nr:AmmeMemoRadiSam system radical SAM enzyme [candidate division Zixibacteria bacterium]MDD4916437.1 AmmeMemoRadiSam system radical SAM enzyme [candidate division Zixibacteria bacterium]MDM7972906.1 AmmeMemoRadiSam system radical SAM enzyme [candidate division Zixibacteria bacterium]HOD66419.1 AmmeMemoRadiSam system radical SAM enzyme [candidate division Zixibacteria bacterium]HOZ07291.1 AmmeMemoRadiSam system radical SAM enzyme [candidate division Zixibacteria bacterium]
MNRRSFLRCLGCGAAATALPHADFLPDLLGGIENACAIDLSDALSSEEARHYTKLAGGGIECRLCPRRCRVTDLERGYCGVRENRGDTYHTLVYGKPCAVNVDPIEKKPLNHFYPGTAAFSLATAGCNVNCKFCQNWEISQSRPEQTKNFDLPPEAAVALCRQQGAPTIAFTYSEPTVFYEYMYDIARLGRAQGIRSVMITGGYIEEAPLAELMPHLDAIKVDLKAIRASYYRDVVRGELTPVLERLQQIRKAGLWLELVYLVVPTLNDSDAEFRELGQWVFRYLGADVPLHFSRFTPQYLLEHLPPTPVATLERAHAIAGAEGLRFVYVGNVPGHRAESTWCPGCGALVIERRGYRTSAAGLAGDRCVACGREIPGRFK